jgi:hypothetical protein
MVSPLPMRFARANPTLGFVLLSLLIHGGATLPAWVAARRAASARAEGVSSEPRRSPVELEFAPTRPTTGPSEVEVERSIPRQEATPRPREPDRRMPPPREPDPFATPQWVQTERPPPPPPPAPAETRRSVQQSAATETAPTNAENLAERNNDVREETIAAVRSVTEDAPNPRAAASAERAPGAGAGAREVHAEHRDRPGADAPSQSASRAGQPPAGAEGAAGQPATGSQGAQGAPPAPPEGNRVFASREGVWGQYALAPERGNDPTRPGPEGTGARIPGRVGVEGRGAAGVMAGLAPGSADYARAFGPAADRERREARERMTRARGESPTESWQQLRAGMENYVTAVRVGNQTSLRAAASPFAAYLAAMHHRIHRLFADGFLAGLEGSPRDAPLNDPNLRATVEIVLERDGRLARVGIARTSGATLFDVASMNSVRRSAPFGAAPEAIRSADGRVYIHWGFYRNERQCGTFNAEPFILSAPDASGVRSRAPVLVPQAGRDR